jgi:hypothetical protein
MNTDILKMGPTAVSETLSANSPYTPCKTPKPKYQRKLYIALSAGIVLEEALNLSYDRLLMMMIL